MSVLATIVVAGGAILFVNAGGKQDSLFAENVEALTETEQGTLIHYVCKHLGCCGGEKKCFSGSFSYGGASISGTFYME